MSKILGDDFRSVMDLKHNIRFVCVIAHDDHAKSTLIDSLVETAGNYAPLYAGAGAGDTTRGAGYGAERGNPISLYYRMSDNYDEHVEDNYIVNLIDFSALTITDGALVVVDCFDGVCARTETMLQQALRERIRPVLALTNMDRCFLDLHLDGEEVYHTLRNVIENANFVLDDDVITVHPEKGSVAFFSGLHGWAFTLRTFARMYASKFGVDESKMMERLWGENFFDPTTKKWTNTKTNSPSCKRGFVFFCYEPIRLIIDACINDEKVKLWSMLAKLGVFAKMKDYDKCLTGKGLMERVMKTWLPARKALAEMMVHHLPSPATAQEYRVEKLYEGPLHDKYADAIRRCDPDGPLMMCISKMIPVSGYGGLLAFGRVFSGKVSTGMDVRIMGGNSDFGRVQRVEMLWGNLRECVEDIPCGNTAGLAGLYREITKNATLTNEDEENAHPIKDMDFSDGCSYQEEEEEEGFERAEKKRRFA